MPWQNVMADLVQALEVMVDHAEETYPHFESPRGQRDIAQARAAITRAQQEMRVKRNPALVVYGNPRPNPALVVYGNPAAVHGPSHMIGKADELRYEWNGEWFKHPFESGVLVRGTTGPRGARQIVLVGVDGQPLWATDAELARGEVVT